jgi:cyclopropane fatty-acyl-phospholipid synthase-like methyltransferase
MEDFWNQRFRSNTYAYGTKPNTFLKQQLPLHKPGKALFPAEGEGRNAVFAAMQGWDVFAFDTSTEGQKKALELAQSKNVGLQYDLSSFDDYESDKESFDALILIFAHMPAINRQAFHNKLSGLLKPGGLLLLEGFSKNQLGLPSGGPKNLEMLFSKEIIHTDFSDFQRLDVEEKEIVLDEGIYHQGKAHIIRAIGKK